MPRAAPRVLDANDDSFIAPVEDHVREAGWRNVTAFRNPGTRLNLRGYIALGRGAGATGGDMRHVTGEHVHRRAGDGLWVWLPGIEGPDGPWVDVPVLARFAKPLEEVAYGRAQQCVVGGTSPPLEANAAGMLGGQLSRKLHTLGLPEAQISAAALRKAWIAEHLGANVPLNTLREMLRVKSLRTIETLVRLHSPEMTTNPVHLAYELGGLTSRADRGKTKHPSLTGSAPIDDTSPEMDEDAADDEALNDLEAVDGLDDVGDDE